MVGGVSPPSTTWRTVCGRMRPSALTIQMLRSPGRPSQRTSSQYDTTPPRAMGAVTDTPPHARAIAAALGEEIVEALEAGPARAIVELAGAEKGGQGSVENVGHSESVFDGGGGQGEGEHEQHAGRGQQSGTGRGHQAS